MASMEIDAQQLGEPGSLEGIQGFHFNNLQSRKMRAVLVDFSEQDKCVHVTN